LKPFDVLGKVDKETDKLLNQAQNRRDKKNEGRREEMGRRVQMRRISKGPSSNQGQRAYSENPAEQESCTKRIGGSYIRG